MVNKYEHFNKSQVELDFHNMGPMRHQEIIDTADEFINEALESGYYRVAIITGTGIHSKNGPVVKPLVEELLKNHPAVRNFKEGKFAHGGSGVFIIKLQDYDI